MATFFPLTPPVNYFLGIHFFPVLFFPFPSSLHKTIFAPTTSSPLLPLLYYIHRASPSCLRQTPHYVLLRQQLLLFQLVVFRPSPSIHSPSPFFDHFARLPERLPAIPPQSDATQVPSLLCLARRQWLRKYTSPSLRLRAARALNHGKAQALPPRLPRPRRYQGGHVLEPRRPRKHCCQTPPSLNSDVRNK